jgi:uncharacterized protein (DUF885 family)
MVVKLNYFVQRIMIKKTWIALSLSLTFGLGACQSPIESPATPIRANVEQSESAKLARLFKHYFTEKLALNPVYATYVGEYQFNDNFTPPISATNRDKERAFEHKYLAAIEGIDATKLSGQDLLSYQVFRHDRQFALKGEPFADYLMPLHQMGGAHSTFAALGSGESAQPFNTVDDYTNFMARAGDFALYMDSAILAMREGISKDIVLPKPLIRKIIPQLNTHLVDDVTASVFYAPLAQLQHNAQLSATQQQQLKQDYQRMIAEVIIPAYRRVHDFMLFEYLPAGRDTVGFWALPNGKAWYEYEIAANTTLALSAQEIHDFGQQEVARILAQMTHVKQRVGFKDDLAAFFEFLRSDGQFFFTSQDALIDGYTQVKAKINQRLPALFELFPKADYEVRPVEAFREASSAGASYQAPAPDGSRPGIFYINSYNLKAQPKYLMETLSIHEAAPGHHFQIAIQQEVSGLPKFRKFGGYTVFSEGWALYAESLGKELGLFTDPYMWYGRLSDEQLRAMRLVVDTGLHAFAWSRQQAIDFMQHNSSLALTDIEAEVERYIAMPGQAVSYKVGQRHIRNLRNKAVIALGDKFDVRKFHTQILIDGALPMPILSAKIHKWIETERN